MSEPNSWSEILSRNAHEFGEKRAYVALLDADAGQQALSYRELQVTVRQLAAVLAEFLPRQSRILLLLPQDLRFIRAFLGSVLAGMVAVPAYLPSNGKQMGKIRNIVADADPQAVVWSRSATPKLQRDLQGCNACESALWLDVDDIAGGAVSTQIDVGPDDLAMLQYTSGSTGDPKGVMLTHRNLLTNQRMIRDTFGHSAASVVLGCLPLYHDMGLIGNILQPLYVGATCIMLSALQVARQPLSWLQNIARYRATTSGGPNTYYHWCVSRINASVGLDDLDLSCWRVAFNGSEPVRSATLDAFTEKFARHGFRRSAFLPVYGLAEASLMVTGRRKAALPTVVSLDRNEYENSRVVAQNESSARPSVSVVSCGQPAAGVQVAVVGTDGAVLQERKIGEVLVCSDSVAQGYWRSKHAHIFGNTVAGTTTDARFLRTGDLGFVLDGELFVTGRAKEVMIVRGRNYHPADIEQTVAAACGEMTGCRNAVFSLDAPGGEEIVVVQEVTAQAAGKHEELRRAIARHCWLEHEVQLLDIVLLRIGAIPRTTSGKTRRLLTRELYASGRLHAEALGRGNASNGVDSNEAAANYEFRCRCLIDRLQNHFPNHTGIDAATALSSLGLDSYAVVKISEQVSRALGIHVPLMEFAKHSTVGELARHIGNQPAIPGAAAAMIAAPKRTLGARFRQSHNQIALWNREKMAHQRSALTVSRAVKTSVRMDSETFAAAVARVVRACDILRTELMEEGGEWLQQVVADRAPSLEYIDAVTWDDERVAELLEQRANASLDIANFETWRWFLLDRPDHSIVLFTFHHIICDLETVNFLIEAVFNACAVDAPAHDAQAQYSYCDFVESQHRFLASAAGRASELFWDRTLQDVELRVDLITNKGRQSAVGTGAGLKRLTFDRLATAELTRHGRESAAGLHALLLAAFGLVLRQYCHQDRFAVAIPVSARTQSSLRHTLGYMINALPIVLDFSSVDNFAGLMRQIQVRTLEALEHRNYPLPLIVQRYRRGRGETVPQLDPVNVIFSYHKAALPDGQDTTVFAMNEASELATHINDVELRSLSVPVHEIEFPLMVTAGAIEGSLTIRMQWDARYMYPQVMHAMFEDYDSLLRRIARTQDLAMLPLVRSDALAC